MIAYVHFGVTAIGVGPSIVRIEFNGPVEVGNRSFIIADMALDIASVVQRSSIFWIELNGAVEIGNRL